MSAAYPPEIFSDPSLEEALEVAQACKLATIVLANGGELITVHAPLAFHDVPGGATFIGHIHRNNPLCEVLRGGAKSMRLIFLPAHGYVSPSVYGEKAVSGKVVPTWNYVAAHIDGMMELRDDAAFMLDTLTRQTREYEGDVGGEWQMSDAPESYIQAQLKGIVGISIAVVGGRSIHKLSQNKSNDLGRIAQWLDESVPPSNSIGYWMRKRHGL